GGAKRQAPSGTPGGEQEARPGEAKATFARGPGRAGGDPRRRRGSPRLRRWGANRGGAKESGGGLRPSPGAVSQGTRPRLDRADPRRGRPGAASAGPRRGGGPPRLRGHGAEPSARRPRPRLEAGLRAAHSRYLHPRRGRGDRARRRGPLRAARRRGQGHPAGDRPSGRDHRDRGSRGPRRRPAPAAQAARGAPGVLEPPQRPGFLVPALGQRLDRGGGGGRAYHARFPQPARLGAGAADRSRGPRLRPRRQPRLRRGGERCRGLAPPRGGHPRAGAARGLLLGSGGRGRAGTSRRTLPRPPRWQPPGRGRREETMTTGRTGRVEAYATLRVGEHRLSLLRDGEQAYPSMLEAIASARSHICLETYIFRADRTGRRFARALAERARAGVEVNVIVDAWGSPLPGGFVRRLQRAGVRILHYNPVRLSWRALRTRFARFFPRNHRKVLVVDNRVGFTGGLNIADDYASERDGGQGWRDTHLRIEGPAVAELLYIFRRTWEKEGGPPLDESRYRNEARRPDPKVRVLASDIRRGRRMTKDA